MLSVWQTQRRNMYKYSPCYAILCYGQLWHTKLWIAALYSGPIPYPQNCVLLYKCFVVPNGTLPIWLLSQFCHSVFILDHSSLGIASNAHSISYNIPQSPSNARMAKSPLPPLRRWYHMKLSTDSSEQWKLPRRPFTVRFEKTATKKETNYGNIRTHRPIVLRCTFVTRNPYVVRRQQKWHKWMNRSVDNHLLSLVVGHLSFSSNESLCIHHGVNFKWRKRRWWRRWRCRRQRQTHNSKMKTMNTWHEWERFIITLQLTFFFRCCCCRSFVCW